MRDHIDMKLILEELPSPSDNGTNKTSNKKSSLFIKISGGLDQLQDWFTILISFSIVEDQLLTRYFHSYSLRWLVIDLLLLKYLGLYQILVVSIQKGFAYLETVHSLINPGLIQWHCVLPIR